MGLQRRMKVGETLYLQHGEEVITIHVEEFTQGEHAKRPGEMIKVGLVIDAPRCWSIDHITDKGISQKTGQNYAKYQRTNQEKVLSQYEFQESSAEAAAKKVREEAIYSHKPDNRDKSVTQY